MPPTCYHVRNNTSGELHLITSLLVGIGAYFIGSISSAVLTCRVMGLPDPREDGSGNPGTTNVLRLGGKKAAAITLIGDMLKGLLPTAVASYAISTTEAVSAAALGSFLGHLYPIWFGFKGGKGVATALGAVIGASWLCGILAAATWLITLAVGRFSSLAALVTFAAVPVYLWLVLQSPLLTATSVLMSGMLYWRHRANISRLLNGEEPKVGKKASKS